MVDFFNDWYSSVVFKNKFLRAIKFYSFYRFFIRVSANLVLPLYFLLTRRNKKYVLKESIKKNGRYIVSFTSFPARINNVWLVVESILRQTQKPDMIILWLSKKQFSSLDVLPKSLLNLQKRGLTIKLKDEDFRSHKKYYYFLKEYS